MCHKEMVYKWDLPLSFFNLGTHSFIHLFKKYLVITCHKPDTVLGTGVNKIDFFHGNCFLIGIISIQVNI